MANPFTYTKTPATKAQAQANINYFWFEGMLTSDEIEELGHIPANYKTYINEMLRASRADLAKFS